jgi:regulator of protease activity HflC (stomatin/prohibitin superfamily)
MKPAPDYVAQALTEQAAEHQAQGYCPLSFDEPATRFVLRETAERAVAIALAEAERYRQLLMGAALRAKSSTPQADAATPTP